MCVLYTLKLIDDSASQCRQSIRFACTFWRRLLTGIESKLNYSNAYSSSVNRRVFNLSVSSVWESHWFSTGSCEVQAVAFLAVAFLAVHNLEWNGREVMGQFVVVVSLEELRLGLFLLVCLGES